MPAGEDEHEEVLKAMPVFVAMKGLDGTTGSARRDGCEEKDLYSELSG